MLSRLLRVILIPPLLIAVTALVIIGLKDFDLLVTITAKCRNPCTCWEEVTFPQVTNRKEGKKDEASGKVPKM